MVTFVTQPQAKKIELQIANHLLEVPNLDGGIRGSGSEDETIRMELGAGQGSAPAIVASVSDPGDQLTSADVREGPVLQKTVKLVVAQYQPLKEVYQDHQTQLTFWGTHFFQQN